MQSSGNSCKGSANIGWGGGGCCVFVGDFLLAEVVFSISKEIRLISFGHQ